jgi:hypothetical protein
LQLLFGFRQLHDIVGYVFQRDELPSARQRDRIVEPAEPAVLYAERSAPKRAS